MSDNNAHRIVEYDVPFYTCNLHCFTNALKYGSGGIIEGEILPNDVAWLENANLMDFLFQNKTSGDNGKIVAICTVPNNIVKQLLGLK